MGGNGKTWSSLFVLVFRNQNSQFLWYLMFWCHMHFQAPSCMPSVFDSLRFWAGGNADFSMDMHQKEQLHDNVSMMQPQHFPVSLKFHVCAVDSHDASCILVWNSYFRIYMCSWGALVDSIWVVESHLIAYNSSHMLHRRLAVVFPFQMWTVKIYYTCMVQTHSHCHIQPIIHRYLLPCYLKLISCWANGNFH